jgi:hypothetical protein
MERGQRSGSARTATWCTTRCAAASSTTWSSPSTAASTRSGACARAAARRCRATSTASARRRASSSICPRDWKRWATADREPIGAVDLRPRHAAGRRGPPDPAVPGAGRLHGTGRRGHAGRGAARARQRPSRGLRHYQRSRVSCAPRASCSRRARWAASSTPRGSNAWCATTSGRAARPNASTTRWSGCTAGRSRTAWPGRGW